jgi:hypothetical protein
MHQSSARFQGHSLGAKSCRSAAADRFMARAHAGTSTTNARRLLVKSKPSPFKKAPPMRIRAQSKRNHAQRGPKRPSLSFHFLPFPSLSCADSRVINGLRAEGAKNFFPSAFPSFEGRLRFWNYEDERRPGRLARAASPFRPSAPAHAPSLLSGQPRTWRLCSGGVTFGT